MALDNRKDPYGAFRFLVELEGLVVGGFAEVSGLQAETEVEEYREGGVNEHPHKLRKITRYPNLVLRRGITDCRVLWEWYRDVIAGTVSRRNGAVILMDREGNPAWRMEFSGAFPVKWEGPELKADGNATAIEKVELVHNGLKVE